MEVIKHEDAYDICFNQTLNQGNLIYNPFLRNTAKEFMPDAENVPSNPDGYTGDCYVQSGVLVTNDITQYLHYGMPIGLVRYSADIKGRGYVSIYAIKNSDSVKLKSENLEKLSYIVVSNENFDNCVMNFEILNNPETGYEQMCEGLGNKIMGIKIEYSGGLQIENINLELLE